jgi:uncharacterized protein YfdQ (DUF2303 family)
MSQENNTQAAIDAGKQIAASGQQLKYIGDLPVSMKPDGEAVLWTKALALLDERQPTPRRIGGTAKFTELASFIEHVNRFKDDKSAVFMAGNQLTAVYNYHGDPATPRWGDHRATYTAPLSSQWSLWTANDGKQMTQEEFGSFIDANLADIAAPAPGDEGKADREAGYVGAGQLATLARNLVINASHKAERKINEQTGDITMTFEVKTDETSSTKLPPGFLLGIPVFEAGALYRVEAKFFLYRSGQGFKLAYKLQRAQDIMRHAVDEIRVQVKKDTSLPVWAGSPEQ